MREKADEARSLLETTKNEVKTWKNAANEAKNEIEKIKKNSDLTVAKLQAELQQLKSSAESKTLGDKARFEESEKRLREAMSQLLAEKANFGKLASEHKKLENQWKSHVCKSDDETVKDLRKRVKELEIKNDKLKDKLKHAEERGRKKSKSKSKDKKKKKKSSSSSSSKSKSKSKSKHQH